MPTKVAGSKDTSFPNGITTSIVNSTSGIRSDRDIILSTLFASGTAAVTQYVSVPYKCELVEVQFVQGQAIGATPPTVVAQIGSAGTTLATLQLTSAGVAGGLQTTTTIASAAVAAGETIGLVHATHATTYGGTASVVLKRVT